MKKIPLIIAERITNKIIVDRILKDGKPIGLEFPKPAKKMRVALVKGTIVLIFE